nr:hypothetical protein [Tanacetum cinerariifolium]
MLSSKAGTTKSSFGFGPVIGYLLLGFEIHAMKDEVISLEDEKVFENTRSITKEDKNEQGKEEKGVVKFFEVGTDEQNNNSSSVLNDVDRIVYGKGNDTWADAGLKHGSYLLFDMILEDGWYFLDESRLSKEPLCRSHLK